MKQFTGADAGLSGDDQVRIALRAIAENGGVAMMCDIYEAVEAVLNPKGFTLSEQGRASLRFYVNKVAVNAGYLHPHDKESPGWRLTSQGHEFPRSERTSLPRPQSTLTPEQSRAGPQRPPAAMRSSSILSGFCGRLTPTMLGITRAATSDARRGVDFVGNRLGDARGEPSSIGVQVKFHNPNNAPTEREWLKFLAGCFSRGLDAAVFVTTGKLTGEQRRECAGSENRHNRRSATKYHASRRSMALIVSTYSMMTRPPNKIVGATYLNESVAVGSNRPRATHLLARQAAAATFLESLLPKSAPRAIPAAGARPAGRCRKATPPAARSRCPATPARDRFDRGRRCGSCRRPRAAPTAPARR